MLSHEPSPCRIFARTSREKMGRHASLKSRIPGCRILEHVGVKVPKVGRDRRFSAVINEPVAESRQGYTYNFSAFLNNRPNDSRMPPSRSVYGFFLEKFAQRRHAHHDADHFFV